MQQIVSFFCLSHSSLSKYTFVPICFLLAISAAAQRGVFLTPTDFLQHAFDITPATETYWFTPESRKIAEAIVQHKLPLRLHYYQAGNRSAWILEEIGKELPITIGIAIEQGQVQLVRVLEYREVRGGEVRYDFFTRQFLHAALIEPEQKLDKSIDGISGATLSVRAMNKTVRLALFLDQQINVATAAN